MPFTKSLQDNESQKLLIELAHTTEQILLSKSARVSYPLAYDKVYQLCRDEKQQLILQKLEQTLRFILPQVFDTLAIQSENFIHHLTELLNRTEKNIQTVRDVCLYLDLKYCKNDLNCKLIDRLNTIFIEEFFKKQPLLSKLGQLIAIQHINKNEIYLQEILKSIKSIDPEQGYFLYHFVSHYLPVLVTHLTTQAQQIFASSSQYNQIQNYIEYAHEILDRQEKFLNRFWPDQKKCLPNKLFILKEIYNVVVTQYKDQFYLNHKEKLFSQLTLQVLQLFKYGQNDVEKHADWYNVQIKEKLSTLKRQDNFTFISQICQFYHQIMTILSKTHNKFDIHYRSRFAFEEWINEEKLQMPIRLNQYIKDYCLGSNIQQNGSNMANNPTKVLQNIGIVFVLMKEKNLFEKSYRRQMINRLLVNYGCYDMTMQREVIKLMQKECSQQFVKNILPIVESYNKHQQQNRQPSPKLNTLLLNTENWPYDEKHTINITINPQLLKIVQGETLNFNSKNKDKTLYWHPIIGVVKMRITFKESTWQGDLIVDTCMANVLLHFVKTNYQPYELNHFCLSTGYQPDQLYSSIKKLLFIKLLINKGTDDNIILSLNQAFSHPSSPCNVISIETSNKFQQKPLQELKADRKFMVEAIIVKLMKRLKHTDKQTILKQAAPLIEKKGFSYNAKFVQSAIERLVDKQFIRDHEDGKLGYIA